VTHRRSFLLLAAISLAACAGAQPPPAFVLQFPLVDHPAYSYTDRLQTATSVPLLSATRPWLGHVHHPIRLPEGARLTREDRRYLAESAAAMRIIGYDDLWEYESGWTRLRRSAGLAADRWPWLYSDGFHLASWRYDTMFSVGVQPVYGLEVVETDDARGTITRFTGGARVEGGYARRLHFMVDFRDHTESGNGPYDSRSRLLEDRWASVDLKGRGSTSYDISESFLQYYGHDLSLAAGRGRFRWGPARQGSLFLNSQMPPFDYLRFDAVLENERSQGVFYTFLHGWLEPDSVAKNLASDSLYITPGGRPRTLNPQKFLSAQRLEVRPRANLLFGFSQGVIYGDRGVQLGYLTPLNFLYSVQHSNDDKDNMVLGFDANWRPVRGVRLYGEAFFDDIVVSALTTSSGSNKSAYTAGIHLAGVRGFASRFDGGIEYSKIRPFVYSHVFAVNAYTHWTSPLGYRWEPNSEFMTAELRGTFYPLQVTLRASRQNHGSVGGSIYEPLSDAAKDDLYPFLAGDVVHVTRIGGSVEWEVLPNLRLRAEGNHCERTGTDNRLEWRGGFAWNP
jgi:hypothetical protein